MTEKPLVSVVIPAFNAERYVSVAIRSVLAQSYSPVECVVVDDGSTDATRAVIRGFGDRVHTVHSENRGVASARNLGARSSKGSFLAFLDADDVWLPRKLERQMEVMLRMPDLGLVYTSLHIVDEHGRYIGRVDAPPPWKALANTLLLEPPAASPASTGLLRRQTFEEVGGFSAGLSTSADCDFFCKIASRHPVARLDAPMALYRHHATQMHSDPLVTRRDMKAVFERFFSDPTLLPSHIRGKRRRAEANLAVSLAGRYRLMGDRKMFLRSIAEAFVKRPDRVLAGLIRYTRPPPFYRDEFITRGSFRAK